MHLWLGIGHPLWKWTVAFGIPLQEFAFGLGVPCGRGLRGWACLLYVNFRVGHPPEEVDFKNGQTLWKSDSAGGSLGKRTGLEVNESSPMKETSGDLWQ